MESPLNTLCYVIGTTYVKALSTNEIKTKREAFKFVYLLTKYMYLSLLQHDNNVAYFHSVYRSISRYIDDRKQNYNYSFYLRLTHKTICISFIFMRQIYAIANVKILKVTESRYLSV